MSGLPAQIPGRRFVRVLRKLGYRAQKRKAQVPEYCWPALAVTRDSFRYGSPIPDKTCANECRASTFGSLSSPRRVLAGIGRLL